MVATSIIHSALLLVCACAGLLRTDTVCGVLLLDEREPDSCARRRAAAWTAVSPGPAQDHHGHEDPAGRVGRREDQMQDDPGELRPRHHCWAPEEEMRSASSALVSCHVDHCSKFTFICIYSLKEAFTNPFSTMLFDLLAYASTQTKQTFCTILK